MSQLNWFEILGWNDQYLENLRATAFLYIRQGKYEVAKEIFHTLSICNPNNVFDLQTLGSIYLQENQASLALAYLEKAKKLDPNNFTVRINHIKAMLSLGYRNEALPLIESFIKTCPDPYMVSDAEALLLAYR